MNRFTLVFVLIFEAIFCFSQDQHFTQFYAAPLTLNPALTGAYDGRYRFSGIYRDQWRGTLDRPYVTFAATLDVRFPLEKFTGRLRDAAAIGLLFYNDKVTGVDFNTNQIALSGAYHKSLNAKNNQYLSIGFQGAIAQRNVNYSELTFDDQFNGTTGYTDPTRENLPVNNFSFSDFAFGLNYSYVPRRFTSLYVGLAMHHVFEPQVSFYQSDEFVVFPESPLFRKYSIHLSAGIPLSQKASLLPRFVASKQGPHLIANIGTNLRYLMSDFNGTAIHFGSWVRPVGNVDDAISLDAVVMMIGLEYNNFLLGLSYDANLNDLRTDRRGQGAFEVSIAYLGNYDNETILCPKF